VEHARINFFDKKKAQARIIDDFKVAENLTLIWFWAQEMLSVRLDVVRLTQIWRLHDLLTSTCHASSCNFRDTWENEDSEVIEHIAMGMKALLHNKNKQS
jgi:hypothetical protein